MSNEWLFLVIIVMTIWGVCSINRLINRRFNALITGLNRELSRGFNK